MRCRVEVYYNGSWGRVQDTLWDLNNAHVVCRQLGCGYALETYNTSKYEASSQRGRVYGVQCHGQEPQLQDCRISSSLNTSVCDSSDVGVLCSDSQLTVRLDGGGSNCSGKVEMMCNKRWGTFCGDSWDITDANVVCRQLGCGFARLARGGPAISQGKGVIWQNDVKCKGSESFLSDCLSAAPGQSTCNHKEIASVFCSESELLATFPSPPAAAISTSIDSLNHIEYDISHNLSDRNLESEYPAMNSNSCPGPLLDYDHVETEDVESQDDHLQLDSDSDEPLTLTTTGDGLCVHAQPPFLTAMFNFQLLATTSHNLIKSEADREPDRISGCTKQDSLAIAPGSFANGSELLTLKHRNVSQSQIKDRHQLVGHYHRRQHFMAACSSSLLGSVLKTPVFLFTEFDRMIVTAQFNINSSISVPDSDRLVDTQANSAETVSLRLANGGSPCAGRVEIHYRGQWGTVDHDLWDLPDAAVVCRELDCGTAVSAPRGAHFGRGSGPIVTWDVQCCGTERALRDCQSEEWNHYSMSHDNDAGVVCSDHISLRLVQGSSQCFGRPEVLFGDTWKTMCGLDWDLKNANVICAQLHCGVAVSVSSTAHSGGRTVLMGTEVFKCTGNETQLGKCPRSSDTHQDCSGHNNVTLICSDENWWPRLVNGGSRCDGRVEVYYNGSWGRVQDTLWDLNDSHVVCRQLGCGHALETYTSSQYEESDGRPWVHDIQCHGKESQLRDCCISGPLNSSVTDSSNVDILCSDVRAFCQMFSEESHVPYSLTRSELNVRGETWEYMEDINNLSPWPSVIVQTEHKEMRLVNGKNRCEGRVEVFYNKTWGTVCSESLDFHDATVICKQLHCGVLVDISYDNKLFGAGTGPIWLGEIDCPSKESTLWQCQRNPWGQHNCNGRKDAGVLCSGSGEITDQPLSSHFCRQQSGASSS
ncbi:scavenger receptor cysteine-rich domain-containing protein DMBT1-like [Chiloscyllium punctatum]|uniref:scavenger receptor cysteine-rich domain-containing protein DMBT1-like n=1 Tax=Chiloscyllium punctatum TaxID=137246 RepID=UPI003B640AFA